METIRMMMAKVILVAKSMSSKIEGRGRIIIARTPTNPKGRIKSEYLEIINFSEFCAISMPS